MQVGGSVLLHRGEESLVVPQASAIVFRCRVGSPGRIVAFIIRYFSQPMVARHPVRMMVVRDDYREQQKHAGNQTDVCRDSFFLHNGDKGTFFLYNIKYRRLLFRLFATKLQGRGKKKVPCSSAEHGTSSCGQ